jgi:tetratricopeptide (TPR) repeat protein
VAGCHITLEHLASDSGDIPAAVTHYQAALDISTENDQPISLAQALNNMANTYLKAGESERTLELCSRALDLFTLAGDHYGAAHVRDTLAQAYHRQDRLDLAASYCRQAANGSWNSAHLSGPRNPCARSTRSTPKPGKPVSRDVPGTRRCGYSSRRRSPMRTRCARN